MNKIPLGRDLIGEGVQICARCIFDSTQYGISFNEQGVCNYCTLIDYLSSMYGTGTCRGENLFKSIVEKIKQEGKNNKYDVAVGVSGGTDSSYMLVLAMKYGLRPLAVHYDNTWNSAIATQNISKVTKALGIDLYTHVCDNKESDDIFKSFFLASVPELDGPTDIALAEVIYRAAARYGVKYVFEGHSFIEEGVAPMGKAYVDGGYIESIHRIFGQREMVTFPNMTFSKFLYWTIFKKIRKIRPYWYLSYSKSDAQNYLRENFKWEYYGGHHLENRMTSFHHGFYTPIKFGLDQRNNTLAASVRNGKISRFDAIREYATRPQIEIDLLNYVLKRFEMDEGQFWSVMARPKKFYTDYPTYKKRFEIFRPLFYVLAKSNLVPMSFYLKYCFPAKAPA